MAYRDMYPAQPDPRQAQRSSITRSAVVLCTFLFSFGFPGKLANFFGGDRVSMLLQYVLFAVQIVIMLISSGDSLMDVKVIDLKKEFTPIYFLLGLFFATSMLVTHDLSSQLISCLRFSVTAMFAISVVQWYDVKQILTFTYWAQSVIVLLCLMYMLALPSQAFAMVDGERSFIGMFPGKNVCGAQLAFGLSMQAALLRLHLNEGRQPSAFFYVILLLQLLMLVMSRAVGSLISGGVPVAYVLLSRGSRGPLRRLPIGMLYILGSVGFLVFALNLMPMLEPVLAMIGKDATLTGRIPMWQQHVSNLLSSHTFTGYGFAMFWENDLAVEAFHAAFDENSWAGSMTTGAHNELIELWLDVGLIGMGAYFFMLWRSFRWIGGMREDVYAFCIAMMLGFLIKGLTERTHSTASFWTLYMFLSCALALKDQASQRTQQPRLRT